MVKYLNFKGQPISKQESSNLKLNKIKKYPWLAQNEHYSYYKARKAYKLGVSTNSRRNMEFHTGNLYYQQHRTSKRNNQYYKQQTIRANHDAAKKRRDERISARIHANRVEAKKRLIANKKRRVRDYYLGLENDAKLGL